MDETREDGDAAGTPAWPLLPRSNPVDPDVAAVTDAINKAAVHENLPEGRRPRPGEIVLYSVGGLSLLVVWFLIASALL